VAAVSYESILRARETRTAARSLRAEAAELRTRTQEARRARSDAVNRFREEQERAEATVSSLGTWPYWAPATRELWDVLVLVPEAA
jgi:L-lactate utilization protein LutB